MLQRLSSAIRILQWRRGLRAGLAVSAALIVCHVFSSRIGWASGWASLGGFEAILVDNGGPYRSRFRTIATLLLGGTLACVSGLLATGSGPILSVLVPMMVTAAFCFAVTFARVAAQPIASTSIIILVIYFAALGSSAHSLGQALWNALAFVLGGGWAAVLSLFLWPVDPFRPARQAVGQCYLLLAKFTQQIGPTERESEAREHARRQGFEWQRQMRLAIESARTALAATAARAPTRTVRARNLTVLLETADILFAGTIRTTELALALGGEGDDFSDHHAGTLELTEFLAQLSDAEHQISSALLRKSLPRDFDSFAQTIWKDPPSRNSLAMKTGRDGVLAHLSASELDARQNIEIAGEALKAVWTGVETQGATSGLIIAAQSAGSTDSFAWFDALRANWTFNSVMMRHALRILVVGAADVLLLHTLHLTHGFWLGMTSIIVLQPYQSQTLKRGIQRVGGTIAGGVLAAALAALIPSRDGIIAVVTVTAVLTLATYAVDYAWYCFFLTPTFVLLSLPHLHDWAYSGVRMLTTVLGAAVAVGAMRFLWPEREHLVLGKLLGRAAAADAEYVRALIAYWDALKKADGAGTDQRQMIRRQQETEVMAPARRACGLAANDLEESLDRQMQESGFRLLAHSAKIEAIAVRREHALTFATYLRRLTQSITTLAVLGRQNEQSGRRVLDLAQRLDRLSSALRTGETEVHWTDTREATGNTEENREIALHQMRRMERQVAILERAAAGVLGSDAGTTTMPGASQVPAVS